MTISPSWMADEEARRAWMAENSMYRAEDEHASCGVGLVVSIDGGKSRKVVELGIGALKAGETLIVELPDADEFAKRAPEQAMALLGWIGDVNARSVEVGEPPQVMLLPL